MVYHTDPKLENLRLRFDQSTPTSYDVILSNFEDALQISAANHTLFRISSFLSPDAGKDKNAFNLIEVPDS